MKFRYTKVKNKYNFELYKYLKQKLEKRIDEFNKKQQFTLHVDLSKEAKDKPKLKEFIPKPFDISEFSSKLIEGIQKEDIKDIIFYNFFNLDKMSRKIHGEDFIKLGNRDVAVKYELKVRQIKRKERAQMITEKIIEDIGIYMDEDDNEIEKIVEDAMKLIELASKVHSGSVLERLVNVDFDTVEKDLNLDNNEFMKVRLDFFQRYGKKGSSIKDKIVLDKWDRIQRLAKEKSNKLKLKKKKKVKKRKKKRNSKYGNNLFPRYRKSKRFITRGKDDDILSKSSKRSTNSNLKSALEKTIITEMNGEMYELNSFSDGDEKPINIFQPIVNKETKVKFRRGVKKAKAFLGILKGAKFRSKKSKTVSMKKIKKKRSSLQRSQTTENFDKILTSVKSVNRFKKPLERISPMNKKRKSVRAKILEKKKKKKIFMSAFRSYLKIKQKEDGILEGIKIKDGWLEIIGKSEKVQKNIKMSGFLRGPSRKGSYNYSDKKPDPNKNSAGSSRFVKISDSRSKKFLNSRRGSIFSNSKATSYMTKLKSQISMDDLAKKMEGKMSNDRFSFKKLGTISDSSYSSNTTESSNESKKSEKKSEEKDKTPKISKSQNLVIPNMVTEFKKQIDNKLTQDLVRTISSNINQTYKKIVNEKENTFRVKIEKIQKIKILNKILEKKLKKVFREKKIMLRAKKKLRKEVQKQVKKMVEATESPGPADILLKIFKKLKHSSLTSEETNDEDYHGYELIKPKNYKFGQEKLTKAGVNQLRKILREFNNFYVYFSKTELKKVNQTKKDFEFSSVLSLLKTYLAKVLIQFNGWSMSDVASLDEIISRVKKVFFTKKMRKKFISDKKEYLKENVFKRLTELESFSMKRLFLSIRRFLLQFRGRYHSKSINEISDFIDDDDLNEGIVDFKPAVNFDKIEKNQKIFENSKKIENEKLFEDYEKNLRENQGKGRFDLNNRLKKLRVNEMRKVNRKMKFTTVEKLLEKIVARALFELIDFSKITKIGGNTQNLSKRGRKMSQRENRGFDHFEILRKAKSLERKLPSMKDPNRDQSDDQNTSLFLKEVTFQEKMPKLKTVNMKFNISDSYRKHSRKNKRHQKEINRVSTRVKNIGIFKKSKKSKRKISEGKKKRLKKKARKLNKLVLKNINEPKFDEIKINTKRKITSNSRRSIKSIIIKSKRPSQDGDSENSPYKVFQKSLTYQNFMFKSYAGKYDKTDEKSGEKENESSELLGEMSIEENVVPLGKNEVEIPFLQKAPTLEFMKSGSGILKSIVLDQKEFSPKKGSPKKNDQLFFLKSKNNKSKKPGKVISSELNNITSTQNKKIESSELYVSRQLKNAYKEFDDTKVKKGDIKSARNRFLKGPNKKNTIIFRSNENLGIFKGVHAQHSPRNLENYEKTENCMIIGKNINKKQRAYESESNDAFHTFNFFRKYNRELINKAKFALLEALSPECIEKIFLFDSSCLTEIQKKIESRLSVWIRSVVYLRRDFMKETGGTRVADNLDLRSMPNKKFLSSRFKFKLRELNLDLKKIGK